MKSKWKKIKDTKFYDPDVGSKEPIILNKKILTEEKIIALIMKGSIYHADEGTSGYLLSNETAKKIYDLLKNAGALQIHDKTDE